MSPEVVVLGAYALVLLAAAAGLDRLAEHTQDRSARFRTAGFRYHPQHDAWVCPRDELLWPVAYDEGTHAVRYRAKPSVCNACPVKAACTSSPHGREVTRALAPWPHSEAGRFHRGVSLLLVCLAAVLLVVAAARNPEPATLVLALPALLTAGLGRHYTEHFRSTPAGFPGATPGTGLRVTPSARTRWGSDVRQDAR